MEKQGWFSTELAANENFSCLPRLAVHCYIFYMTQESWKTIGVRMKRLRRIYRLTQDDVAEALELKSKARISRWEHGEQMPGEANKMKLCALYKTMYDQLFYELRQEAVEAINRYHTKAQAREVEQESSSPP